MQKGITPKQKLILLSLADRADENNRCWPSIKRLWVDTCIGNSHTVIDGLKALEAKGLIRVDRESGKGSAYTLLGVEMRESAGAKTGTGVQSGTGAENGTTTGAKTGTGTGAKTGTLNLPIEPTNEEWVRNIRLRRHECEKCGMKFQSVDVDKTLTAARILSMAMN